LLEEKFNRDLEKIPVLVLESGGIFLFVLVAAT
ncbi:unnamed protein product, partial [marine sediment metagenome]